MPSQNACVKLAMDSLIPRLWDPRSPWHAPGPSYQVQKGLYRKALHAAVAISSQALQGL